METVRKLVKEAANADCVEGKGFVEVVAVAGNVVIVVAIGSTVVVLLVTGMATGGTVAAAAAVPKISIDRGRKDF